MHHDHLGGAEAGSGIRRPSADIRMGEARVGADVPEDGVPRRRRQGVAEQCPAVRAVLRPWSRPGHPLHRLLAQPGAAIERRAAAAFRRKHRSWFGSGAPRPPGPRDARALWIAVYVAVPGRESALAARAPKAPGPRAVVIWPWRAFSAAM